jgi:hypothetical protein
MIRTNIILLLVLTPHLARAKVRKEKKLLSGSDQPVEEPEEVCNDSYATRTVSILLFFAGRLYCFALA